MASCLLFPEAGASAASITPAAQIRSAITTTSKVVSGGMKASTTSIRDCAPPVADMAAWPVAFTAASWKIGPLVGSRVPEIEAEPPVRILRSSVTVSAGFTIDAINAAERGSLVKTTTLLPLAACSLIRAAAAATLGESLNLLPEDNIVEPFIKRCVGVNVRS